jgi:hypothetical protein
MNGIYTKRGKKLLSHEGCPKKPERFGDDAVNYHYFLLRFLRTIDGADNDSFDPVVRLSSRQLTNGFPLYSNLLGEVCQL